MKKNKILTILIGLVVVLGAAGFLYDKLGSKVAPNALVIEDTETEEMAGLGNETEKDLEAETQEGQSQAQPAETVAAPDFAVYDAEGQEVLLSDYFGKPIVLNFWASWCGPCRSEMPDFDAVYQEKGDQVHFVMVNLTDGSRESKEGAQAFVEKEGFEFPILFDQDSSAAIAYEIYSIPTTYFINAEGRILAQAQGMINMEALQKGIDLIQPN